MHRSLTLLAGALLLAISGVSPARSDELHIGFLGAAHRHLHPARHRYGQRLPDVSGRAWRQTRRRQGEVHRRGRPGQARRRRRQGEETHFAGQGGHAGRRGPRFLGLRAGAGLHRREDALHGHRVDRRRSRAAASRQISVSRAADLGAIAAEPSARAMGLRPGLQEGRRHRRRLRLWL